MKLEIVIFGLSITSSWGNGHATTYRALVRALAARGHRVTFIERDVPWYRQHRDLSDPPYCRVALYEDLRQVASRHTALVSSADLVVLGSYVPSGALLADWITMRTTGVTAFYDIDTPVTLAKLEEGSAEYMTAALVPRFDLYLSFAGGPLLATIERRFGSPRARPLYCGVDPQLHRPIRCPRRWALGYLGTYSEDRRAGVSELLLAPAKRLGRERFVIGGAQYPGRPPWPANLEHIEHLPPRAHAGFYCAQRYTLNITRARMIEAGFSPSVRLFEAAACGVPIITDRWAGIETMLRPGEEVLVVDRSGEVVDILQDLPEERRIAVAAAARRRVLSAHTAEQRAWQLETYCAEVRRKAIAVQPPSTPVDMIA
jgi:spore maturation protein CgeB